MLVIIVQIFDRKSKKLKVQYFKLCSRPQKHLIMLYWTLSLGLTRLFTYIL